MDAAVVIGRPPPSLLAGLRRAGLRVFPVATANDALRLLGNARVTPVVILDESAGLTGRDVRRLCRTVLEQAGAPLVRAGAHDLPGEPGDSFGCLGYDDPPATLRAEALVAINAARVCQEILRERDRLAREVDQRRTVERAKALLMQALGISEQQAHQRLRRESMNRRRPIGDIAAAVLALGRWPEHPH